MRATPRARLCCASKTRTTRATVRIFNVIYDSLALAGMMGTKARRWRRYGPYRQSERDHVYKEYLQKLKDAGCTYEKDGAIWFKLLGERYDVFDDHRQKTVTKVKAAPTVIEDQIRGHRGARRDQEDFGGRQRRHAGFPLRNRGGRHRHEGSCT